MLRGEYGKGRSGGDYQLAQIRFKVAMETEAQAG